MGQSQSTPAPTPALDGYEDGVYPQYEPISAAASAAPAPAAAAPAPAPAAAKSEKEKCLELLNCPVSLETMLVPVILPCQHSMDFSSAKDWFTREYKNKGKIECMYCKQEVKVVGGIAKTIDSLPINRALMQLAEAIGLPPVDLSKVDHPRGGGVFIAAAAPAAAAPAPAPAPAYALPPRHPERRPPLAIQPRPPMVYNYKRVDHRKLALDRLPYYSQMTPAQQFVDTHIIPQMVERNDRGGPGDYTYDWMHPPRELRVEVMDILSDTCKRVTYMEWSNRVRITW